MGAKLLVYFLREISAFIYNFPCEITKLLRYCYEFLSAKMA